MLRSTVLVICAFVTPIWHDTNDLKNCLDSPNQTLARISKDFSPESDIEARRMTKEDFPGRYPYRDSGLKYWEAIHTWVKDYLDVSLGWS